MKRVFIAVDISDEARRRAADHAIGLRREFAHLRVGWERAEKLHLTLKFLGETVEAAVPDLCAAVERAAREASPFTLAIADVGVFPNARRGRVLWLDVRGETPRLAALNRRLESECERLGFARERREFVPHLTIARLKEPEKSRPLVEKHLALGFAPVAFPVNEIVVYESILLPSGSVYRKLKAVPLGAEK